MAKEKENPEQPQVEKKAGHKDNDSEIKETSNKAGPDESVIEIQATKEFKELQDKYLRLAAELENFKKRSARELSRIIETAGNDLVFELLQVVDDFDRALKHDADDLGAFKQGTEMIFAKLLEILQKRGLREIKAVGEAFDPVYHEAVMQKEVDDKEDGIILEEIQKGYYLNDKILRPARVIIAKKINPESDKSS